MGEWLISYYCKAGIILEKSKAIFRHTVIYTFCIKMYRLCNISSFVVLILQKNVSKSILNMICDHVVNTSLNHWMEKCILICWILAYSKVTKGGFYSERSCPLSFKCNPMIRIVCNPFSAKNSFYIWNYLFERIFSKQILRNFQVLAYSQTY